MFHKPGVASSSSAKDAPLKKSEKRKLRDTLIRSIFPSFSNSSTEEEASPAMIIISEALSLQGGGDILERKVKLNPSKGHHETNNKTSSKAGCVMLYLRTPCSPTTTDTHYWPYRNTTQPILLELEHEFIKDKSTGATKQVLLPCLPLLSALPFLCLPFPRVLIHSQVSTYLCRGANLMRSGVHAILPPPSAPLPPNSRSVIVYPRGMVVSIHVINNPTPMALGVLVAAFPTEMRIGPGAKGICVEIITCYGDDLWNISKEEAKKNKNCNADWEQRANYGNVGFVDGKVVMGLQDETFEADLVEDQESNSDREETDHNELKTLSLDECDAKDDEVLLMRTVHNVEEESSVEKTKEILEASPTNTEPQEDDKLPDDTDQDALLCYSFQRALLTTVTDKLLPLPVSTLYGTHILPARPPGTNLDMKHTRFKKIGVFLVFQSELGIIETKPSPDGREVVAFVTKVNRSHPALRKAKQLIKKHAMSGADAASETLRKAKKLNIVDLYKIPSGIASALELNPDDVSAAAATSEARRGTGFLTGKEVKEIFNAYIAREMLVDESKPANIKMNCALTDALYKLTKKQQMQQEPSQETATPTTVSRKDLLDLWVSKLEPAYALVAMPGSEVLALKKGSPKKIDIEVEKRQGNKKFITRIRGLEEVSRENDSFYLYFSFDWLLNDLIHPLCAVRIR